MENELKQVRKKYMTKIRELYQPNQSAWESPLRKLKARNSDLIRKSPGQSSSELVRNILWSKYYLNYIYFIFNEDQCLMKYALTSFITALLSYFNSSLCFSSFWGNFSSSFSASVVMSFVTRSFSLFRSFRSGNLLTTLSILLTLRYFRSSSRIGAI